MKVTEQEEEEEDEKHITRTAHLELRSFSVCTILYVARALYIEQEHADTNDGRDTRYDDDEDDGNEKRAHHTLYVLCICSVGWNGWFERGMND